VVPADGFFGLCKEDDNAIGQPRLEPFRAAFDFRELNPKTNRYVQISDQKRIEEIERQISPVTHVDETDPPVMLIHGDADNLVPIQQSELLVQKLRDANVEVKLVVRKGMGHGWPKLDDDRRELADWFDAHLLEVTSTAPSTQPAGSRSDTSQAEPSSAQGSRSSR
jgi:acetyl esterase/lipase